MAGTFERVEYKYLLSPDQYESLRPVIEAHFAVDQYGESTIQSLYYDTDDYRLVRRSIEKPRYKEKLRHRSYGLAKADTPTYFEIKKKYAGVVYKRRVAIPEEKAKTVLNEGGDGQIEREIHYFSTLYPTLAPKVMILYDRTAMVGKDNDVRLTLDRRIRFRTDALDLHTHLDGKLLFEDGSILMEIKTNAPFPLWLCRAMAQNGVYQSSFSKYGTVYQQYISPNKE